MRRFPAVATILLALPAAAQQPPRSASLCIEPRAPTLAARKPDKPLCALHYACIPAQVRDYQGDVARFEAAMAQYAREADGYTAAAHRYVRCLEASIGDRSLRRPR